MTPVELAQWETTSFSGAVPAVAVEGQTLFANYLGHVFAVDLASGKMLWRSASFHNLEQAAMQGQSQMIDTNRFAILAAPGLVWSLGRDVKDPNYQADVPPRLPAGRERRGRLAIARPARLRRDGLRRARRSWPGGPCSSRASRRARRTAVRTASRVSTSWRSGRTTASCSGRRRSGSSARASGTTYYGPRDTSPQPRLIYRAGSIYVDTHNGVLARLDAESGAVDWGYGYPTEPVQSQGRFFIFFDGMPQAGPDDGRSDAAPGRRRPADQGGQVGSPLRDRPRPDEGPLGPPDRQVGTPARGRRHGPLPRRPGARGPRPEDARRSAGRRPCPAAATTAACSCGRDGLWQLTPRGIFEVDPQTGPGPADLPRARTPGATGGDLILTDRWLLAISNRTISAYPRRSAGAERIARDGRGGTQNGGVE